MDKSIFISHNNIYVISSQFKIFKRPIFTFKINHISDEKFNDMKRNITIFLLIFIILLPNISYGRRLYYAEEFYLYVLNLYHTNSNLERNIRFMQWSLKAPFDNPVRSLALIKTEDDLSKYKLLFKMHVNLLIVDSYLKLAKRFDKEHIYFYNLRYAEDLKKSMIISKYYYQIALNYWEEVKKFAAQCDEIPARINIDQWEDDLYLIQTAKLNYNTIINEQLKMLEKRLSILNNYLSKN